MLKIFIFVALFILNVQSYNNRYKEELHEPWNTFDLFAAESRSDPEARDVEEVTEKDREPLAPNYKDPDDIEVPDEDFTSSGNQKPLGYEPSLIPGGVIDVDANGDDFGFSSFPHISDTFGFTSSFGGSGSGSSGNGFPDFFGLGGLFGSVAQLKPWWKGENVCIEREEASDDDNPTDSNKKLESVNIQNYFSASVRVSNCQETDNKYECITKINTHGIAKTLMVRYKCCYGFQRTADSSGCTKRINLVPLLDTIANIKENEFRNLIQSTGLENKFGKENLTVFVPTNDALSVFSDLMNQLNQIDPARRRRQIQNAISSKELVLNHVVLGYNDLTDAENEDILYSENNKNPIRVNTYPTKDLEKMITLNCAQVNKENNLASNGVVHVIDGVLSPVTQTVAEIIAEHPQLSSLRQALQNANLTKNFKPSGHYTIFAPTDEAFNKLEDSAKQQLINGDSCAATILKHHIVGHTVCTAAIVAHATTHSVDGGLLNLEKTSDDVILFENKANVIKRDIVATNGVIHLIDTVVIPDTALYITQSLKKENFTKFLNLIQESGLGNEIDALKNVTVFAPSDRAFDNPDSVKLLQEVRKDKQKLRDLIMYHTTQGELESSNMNNNMLIKSNTDKNLRLNLYSTLPVFDNFINRATVNCARVTGYDEKCCSSMIHEVNQILTPPTQTLLDVINTNEDYTHFRKILNGTDVEETLKDNSQSLTLLVPSDESFTKMDDDLLKSLVEDKKKGSEFLKHHILTEVLCCSGVGPHTWSFNTLVSTLANSREPVSRMGNNIRIGSAILTDCDTVATNGVIHSLNKVLYPTTPRNNGFSFLIFDF